MYMYDLQQTDFINIQYMYMYRYCGMKLNTVTNKPITDEFKMK